MRYLTILCLLLLLTGCQYSRIKSSDITHKNFAVTATPKGSLENLIDFSSRFQSHGPKAQIALCTEMREALKKRSDPWTAWYLATAISQVNECGKTEEAIALIKQMLNQRFVSDEVAWVALYQISLLKNQLNQKRQLEMALAGQQKLQQRLIRVDKTNSSLETKLQDLKRIETSIIQRLDEKQHGTN